MRTNDYKKDEFWLCYYVIWCQSHEATVDVNQAMPGGGRLPGGEEVGDAGAGVAVAVGVDGMAHGGVGGRVGEQFGY